MFMFALLVASIALAQARKTCQVASSVAGKDAGPRILDAFRSCSDGGKILLDGYYLVDTVLDTTGHNIEIELSGTLQYSPDISKWSNTSIYLTYQVSTVLTTY